MEIINLKDQTPEENKKGENSVLKITGLKQGAKNPNRVNVFINEKYAFSLDVTQVVDFKLKTGMEISEEQLFEYKKASEFGKLYQRTLEWVLMRPRAEKEVRDYLWRKLHKASSGTASRRPVFTGGARLRSRQQPPKDPSEAYVEFSEELDRPDGSMSSEDVSELSENILKRLSERGYVDDRKFAEFYVENRFVKRGISRKRLQMELMKKGVAREIIDEVLNGRNDEEEILKIIAKKRSKYDDEKLTAYLVRQGFSYDLVTKCVQESDN
ncbi:RecX family transcriptional regulator [Candidatus Saccharibacteria bacterium]|nr:RecX family transcriptional regulator [Candidatus Saccharibacteria bacterium]